MNTPQQKAIETPANSTFAFAAGELARINPSAFSKLDKRDAIAAILGAMEARPRIIGDQRASELNARKLGPCRTLLEKLRNEHDGDFDAQLFTDCLKITGVKDRKAIIALLRAYHARQYEVQRAAERRAERGAHGSLAQLAAIAAKPLRGATAEENAMASAGHARLRAGGAFS